MATHTFFYNGLSFENNDIPHLYIGMIIFHKNERENGLHTQPDILQVERIDLVSVQPFRIDGETRSHYEVHCKKLSTEKFLEMQKTGLIPSVE